MASLRANWSADTLFYEMQSWLFRSNDCYCSPCFSQRLPQNGVISNHCPAVSCLLIKVNSMPPLALKQDPRVAPVFQDYPEEIKPKMDLLRNLILETAEETASVLALEETLKWGEPSYLTKHGSTIRIDWKSKKPDQYCIYFKCTSKLVPTIRALYGGLFDYENNRALIFTKDEEPPIVELKECIRMALQYHKVKHLPRLGY